jgi:CHASE2 domain-containing sensor protein
MAGEFPHCPQKLAKPSGGTCPQIKTCVSIGVVGLAPFVLFGSATSLKNFLRQDKKRPSDEFTGKIVIVGSTPSALFDTKPTPMEKVHPGVEILATAIDNLKNGDWITQAKNPWVFAGLALGLIWMTALAFLTGVKRKAIDMVFAGSQVGLMAFTFASLNFTTYYYICQKAPCFAWG